MVAEVAIIIANTKIHSSSRLRKCFGRPFGSGGRREAAISAPVSMLLLWRTEAVLVGDETDGSGLV